MDIKVPDMGESVVEATVGRWMKKEGDRVRVSEPIVELETDKVNLEVGAEQDGILAKIVQASGADVKVGDVLGVIEPVGAVTAPSPQPDAVMPAIKAETAASERPTEKVVPTPVAKRVAQDLEVDLTKIAPSGPGNRITKNDVEKFAAEKTQILPTVAPKPTSTSAPERERVGRETREKMSRRRRTIAQRLVEAKQVTAMLTTFNEVDMGAVMELREKRKVAFKEKFGIGLGITSFFVKAAIGALKEFPHLNAELQGDDMILKHYFDIGIAVGAAEGLVVPVLRDADRMSFADIEKEIKKFSQQSEAGTLALEDLRGGSFTITNGGVFGSLMSTPILNYPQVGILGLHGIKQRPVVYNGQIAIRPMMYLALSYDHRIVDGSESVRFLVRVKELIEDPTSLLLEG